MEFKKMPKLAERLIYTRKMKNLSQAELAEKAGTTQQAIQQAEKGKARQPRYLNRLAQALDIPVEWMVFGEEQNNVQSEHLKTTSMGLEEKPSEILDSFFAMPKKDQDLILELMKSRKGK